jgi:DNA-binding SARP family transcriptional activator
MNTLFCLLGPVVVRRGGAEIGVRRVKPAAFLVTLMIRRNMTVSLDHLAEALWDGEPPASAVANLRTYTHDARRLLGEFAPRLVCREGGYALEAAPEECDYAVFQRLAGAGRVALAHGDAGAAARTLEQALSQWRSGRAAEGVPRCGPLFAALQDLDDERSRAIEDFSEALIELGECRAAASQLAGLLSVAPLRDRAWRLRLWALGRLGEIDAVERCYRQAVTVFRTELGVAPAADLTSLYHAALRRSLPSPRKAGPLRAMGKSGPLRVMGRSA